MTTKIAIVVGSLRKESASRRIAGSIQALAPKGMSFEFVEIGTLPHYNQDEDVTPVEAVKTFRAKIKAADAVLFVTPEFNRSVPGALKNALDIGSRPYGQSAWNGKPAAVISTSIGPLGGFGANHHLRQSLAHLNMPTLGQPEAYIGNSANVVSADGKIANDATRDFFVAFLAAFASLIQQVNRKDDAGRAAA
jgi:chromate reductase